MPKLSPAAQAVLDAYWKSPWDLPLQNEDRYAIAAALEAAADQVVPEDPCGYDCCITQCEQIRAALLSIATELKAHD